MTAITVITMDQAALQSMLDQAAAKAVQQATAAQPPADGALNTIAAMFHSGEEIEGPDGLAVMVDMSVWNDALDAFDEISGDEMEPAHPTAGIWVPTELAERVQETMGEFLMDHGWRQQDMDTSDEFGALLAVAPKAEPLYDGDERRHVICLCPECVRAEPAPASQDAEDAI